MKPLGLNKVPTTVTSDITTKSIQNRFDCVRPLHNRTERNFMGI